HQDPARAGLSPAEASETVLVHFSSFVGGGRVAGVLVGPTASGAPVVFVCRDGDKPPPRLDRGHAAERADSSLDSMVPTTFARSASKAARPSSRSWAMTVSSAI